MWVIQRFSRAVKSKEWRVALFEFALIFFAVIVGTWAENWRVSLGEREHLKSNLELMIKNLEQDIYVDSFRVSKSDSILNELLYLMDNLDHSGSLEQKVKCYEIGRRMFFGQMFSHPTPNTSAYDVLSKQDFQDQLMRDSLLHYINGYYKLSLQAYERQNGAGFRTRQHLEIICHNIFNSKAVLLIRKNMGEKGSKTEYVTEIKKNGYQPFSNKEKNEYLWHIQQAYGLTLSNKQSLTLWYGNAKLLKAKIQNYLNKHP